MGRPVTAGYLEDLKEIVRNAKLEQCVRFLDFQENPFPAVNQADIVLVCSRSEAFGRVTLEAMLLRKPVIGVNSGGTTELIREGFNGLLFEPGDYVQLADKIRYLMEHQGKIKEFGENGYEFAKEKFTKEEFSGKVYKLLMNLKGSKNPCSTHLFRFITNLMSDTLWEIESALKGSSACAGNILEQIGKLKGQLAEKEGQLAEKERRLTAFLNSWSWKITGPLRRIHSTIFSKTLKNE
jgi:hypothetical protein